MQKKLTLLFSVIVLSVAVHAQTITIGDINLNKLPTAVHDSQLCKTTWNMVYDITIQNSFMGDSVKIIDWTFNTLIYAAGNTTGQNPWTFTYTFPVLFDPDWKVSNGMIYLSMGSTKVISGPDTMTPVNNTWYFPVSNPCDYDSVSGRVYADYNANCTYDAGDIPLVGMWMNAVAEQDTPSNISHPRYAFTDTNGFYIAEVQKSHLDYYSVYFNDVSLWFTFPPQGCSTWIWDSLHALPNQNIDFALACSNNTDLRCNAASPPSVRPLIPFILGPRVSNLGCPAISGTMHLVLDPRVVYNAGLSTNPANSVSGDTLIWNYTNLSSLATIGYWNSLLAGVHLTPNGSLNIGDSACFQVFTHIPVNDINSTNNHISFCLPVVNSYDPNIKEVSPKGEGAEGFIPVGIQELIYTIHFQNTGNAPALTVTIKDTIDADIIQESLEVLASSHRVSPRWLGGNKYMAFTFSGINLPDSASNEPKSHGMVRFKARLKPGLSIGTQIRNRAGIYFDNNQPIYTNAVINTLTAPATVEQPDEPADIEIFPNPANDVITLGIDETMIGSTAILTDITGRKLAAVKLTTVKGQLTTENFGNGIYFVTVTNGRQSATKKLVINK